MFLSSMIVTMLEAVGVDDDTIVLGESVDWIVAGIVYKFPVCAGKFTAGVEGKCVV